MLKLFTSNPKLFKLTTFAILVLMMLGITALYFSNYKWATVYVDGKIYECVTLAKNIQEVLEEVGVELREEDYVFPGRAELLKRQTAIAVVRAQPYAVTHDGKCTVIWSAKGKVADVLNDLGVGWQEQDLVSPPLDSPVAGVGDITVVRVRSDLSYEISTLPCSVHRVANNSLYRGQERVVQLGRDGEVMQVVETVYHDHFPVESRVIDREVRIATRDKIVEYGTISSINRGGYSIGIRRVLDVSSTAYCSGMPGSECPVDERGYSKCTGKATGYTATGRKAKQGSGTQEDPYIIAVDPRMIPLNTLCYLSFNKGGVTTKHGRIISDGFAIAADTGGAIKGNRIDILFDNHWVAWYYGRKNVRVFVVESVRPR